MTRTIQTPQFVTAPPSFMLICKFPAAYFHFSDVWTCSDLRQLLVGFGFYFFNRVLFFGLFFIWQESVMRKRKEFQMSECR